jgi:hypothetical protein
LGERTLTDAEGTGKEKKMFIGDYLSLTDGLRNGTIWVFII